MCCSEDIIYISSVIDVKTYSQSSSEREGESGGEGGGERTDEEVMEEKTTQKTPAADEVGVHMTHTSSGDL